MERQFAAPRTLMFQVFTQPEHLKRWWQGNIVTHWTEGSKYTGTFSEDGNILSGGWRPEEGKEGPENVAYDAIMTRVNGE